MAPVSVLVDVPALVASLRPVVALAAGTLVLAVARPAAANPWLEAQAELGLVSGHFEFEKPYRTYDGFEAVAHDEGGPLGVAVGLGGIAGFHVGSKLGLGLFPRVEIAPYLEHARPRHASVTSHLLVGVGPVLAFRPSPELELRFSTEWAWASTQGGVTDIGADDNVFEHESLSGPGAGLSLGYVSAPGWVFGLTGRAALLDSEHISFTPLWFSIFAGWSTF